MGHVPSHFPPELYEPFGPFPAPPYLYDDPRISWDEPCFSYDGGFDYYCLFPEPQIPRFGTGKSSTSAFKSSKRKSYPQSEVMEILFKVAATTLNNERISEDIMIVEEKKYVYNKTNKEQGQKIKGAIRQIGSTIDQKEIRIKGLVVKDYKIKSAIKEIKISTARAIISSFYLPKKLKNPS
jgi:hypothetical protein